VLIERTLGQQKEDRRSAGERHIKRIVVKHRGVRAVPQLGTFFRIHRREGHAVCAMGKAGPITITGTSY